MKLRMKMMIYLMFGSLLMTIGTSATLSKYTSTVAGTTTVSIAAVALDGVIWFEVSGISPIDSSKTYQFQVINQNIKDNQVYDESKAIETIGKISEVTQDYTIRVETTNNLPLTFQIKNLDVDVESVDGSTVVVTNPEETTESGFTTYTYSGGQFPFANNDENDEATKHTYEITATWDQTVDDYNNWKYGQEVEYIGVYVDSVQVD